MASANGLGAYRQLLRAIQIAFQGDYRMLHEARLEARRHFETNRQLSAGTPQLIQSALEAAQYLKSNIVQGEKYVETNKQGEKVERYALRIHEHTERGDNDTIKTAGNKTMKAKPCSN